MIGLSLKTEIENATKLIDNGKASYGSIAKHFGVSKATVHRIHLDRLKREINEKKDEIKDLESKLRNLRAEYSSLKSKYRDKQDKLESEYLRLKNKLIKELQEIHEEIENLKNLFTKQKLDWDEGVKIVHDIISLKKERDRISFQISSLEKELEKKNAEVEEAKSRTKQLKKELKRLEILYADLFGSYVRHLVNFELEIQKCKAVLKEVQNEVILQERKESELKRDIAILERMREELKNKVEREMNQGSKEKMRLRTAIGKDSKFC